MKTGVGILSSPRAIEERARPARLERRRVHMKGVRRQRLGVPRNAGRAGRGASRRYRTTPYMSGANMRVCTHSRGRPLALHRSRDCRAGPTMILAEPC